MLLLAACAGRPTGDPVGDLLAAPAANAARLRDPLGPLASAWPQVAGDLSDAPVWVLRIHVEEDERAISYDGILAWTAPRSVDHLTLRLPVEALGGRVDRLQIDGAEPAVDRDLVKVRRVVSAGETVAVRITGRTVIGEPPPGDVPRLMANDTVEVFASWLPLPTPCDRGRCDEVPYSGVSDPGAFPAMVFLGSIDNDPGWTLIHPGTTLPSGDFAAIGVRELPVVTVSGWTETEDDDGPLPVAVWSPAGNPAAAQILNVARGAENDFDRRFGPLSVPRLDLVLVQPEDSGVELPGMALVPSTWSAGGCYLVTHEVAHQWWYGDVGSDALIEPWVDESTASWAAFEACSRAGDPWAKAQLARLRPVEAPTSVDAGTLGKDGWNRVYTQGAGYFDALHEVDPVGLDSALNQWHRAGRWRFETGSELRATLGEALGRDVEQRSWSTWMGP